LKNKFSSKNIKNFEKISVVLLGVILLSSVVPLQSTSAALAIDFDKGGNLSQTSDRSQSPQIAVTPDGAVVLWRDGSDIFFGDITNSGTQFTPGNNIGDGPVVVFGGPQLAVSGDNVHSVWMDGTDIKFIPSFDKGVTHNAGDLETVSSIPSTGTSVYPHVGASGSDVYVVWEDFPFIPGDIFFRASSDNGLSFNSIFNAGSSKSAEAKPKVASFGNDVYIAWSSNSGTDGSILFRSNDNKGNVTAWSAEKDLASGGTTKNPVMVANENNVYLAWWEDGDIFSAFSSDNGANFVINDIGDSASFATPQMALSDSGDLYVVWDQSASDGDIKFRSRDSSGTWTPTLTDPPINLSSSLGDSSEPHIAASGDDVYVVWTDKSNDSDGDILFKASDSNGANFGLGCGEPITDDASLATDAHVAALGNTVFVVWKDISGDTDILFKAGQPTNVFEFDQCQYKLGDTAQITYTDLSLATTGAVNIKITSTSDPTSLDLFILTETPEDSGTFVGQLTFDGTATSGTTIKAAPGDKIEATLVDRTIIANVYPRDLEIMQDGLSGAVTKFDFGEAVNVVVTDQNANLNPNGIDQIIATITSKNAEDSKTLTLVESGPDTGIFGGSSKLIFTNGTGSDQLPISSKVTISQNASAATIGLDAGEIDTITDVLITSTSDPTGVRIDLTETGQDTKEFENENLVLHPSLSGVISTGETAIKVAGGDILTVQSGLFTSNYLVSPNPNPSLAAILVSGPGTDEKVTIEYNPSVIIDVEDLTSAGGGGGGFGRTGLVVNALGFLKTSSALGFGGGGSGPAPPTITSSTISLEPDPSFTQLGLASYFGVPTVIDLGDSSGPISIQTSQSITFTFDIYENQGINNLEHVTMYFFAGDTTDLGNSEIISKSDTYILFDTRKSVYVIDPHGYFANAEFVLSEKDTWNFEIKYDITFAKPMETSSILIRSWDNDKNTADKIFINAIEVVAPSFGDVPNEITSETFLTQTDPVDIPIWIKNNAMWWNQQQIDDSDFVAGIEYLMAQNIINIPAAQVSDSGSSQEIPAWIRDVAGFWAENSISDAEFVQAIQWMISNGIMKV